MAGPVCEATSFVSAGNRECFRDLSEWYLLVPKPGLLRIAHTDKVRSVGVGLKVQPGSDVARSCSQRESQRRGNLNLRIETGSSTQLGDRQSNVVAGFGRQAPGFCRRWARERVLGRNTVSELRLPGGR